MPRNPPHPLEAREALPFAALFPFAAGVGLVAAAALVAELSVKLASPGGLSLIFLLAVVVSANRFGLWPAVLASILGVLCWDFFFTRPYFSFLFDDPRDVYTLVVFLIVSLVVSEMTHRIRVQNAQLATLARSISRSYDLSQSLSQLATAEALATFVASTIAETFSCDAVVLLARHDGGVSRVVYPQNAEFAPEDMAAAEAALREGPAPTTGRLSFQYIRGTRAPIGIAGLRRLAAPPFSEQEMEQLQVFLGQAAIAIERAWLARDLEHSKVVAETERVRNALLTSVSHDLRTPLTSIIGALSALGTLGPHLDATAQSELLSTARDEAERLNRFVGNLLDITRLESGSLTAKLVPVDVGDVVDSALERAKPLLVHHAVEVDIPEGLPEARGDFALLEQVFFNLLDNAAKYSAQGTTIRLQAEARGEEIVVEVIDEGPGIPDHALDAVFEKFARFARQDSVTPGTGLGLMICRGFVAVMGGAIAAANRTDGRGAVFTLRLTRDPLSMAQRAPSPAISSSE